MTTTEKIDGGEYTNYALGFYLAAHPSDAYLVARILMWGNDVVVEYDRYGHILSVEFKPGVME